MRSDEGDNMSGNLDGQVVEFVQSIVTAMGLTMACDVEETPDHIRLNLSGDDAEVLLKRQGEVLDALQVIVNTAFRRDQRGDRHYVVDALGFRRDKDAELRQMAKFLMQKAHSSGMPQEIGPLNPYARRIVHLTVADDVMLTSESIGDAFMKSVVISLKSD
jgi:spoIIIJ-associated protein